MARLLAYLFDLIVVTIVGWVIARVIQRLSGNESFHASGPRAARGDAPRPTIPGQTVRDPVCGMFVSTELSHRLTRGKETLHFCSRECLERYQSDAKES